jgi:CRP-like cAMP-binding protein
VNTSLGPEANPIIRKLESIFQLSEEERAAIADLPMQVAEIRSNQDIVREGDRPSRCFALLEGFTCTFKLTGEGKRQILAFGIAGDMPDLQSLHLHVLDASVGTLTRCKVGFIEHEVLHGLCDRFPRVADAFWRETLIEASVFREWMTNVGRRQAYGRIAHLLCELVVRMRAVGLADDHACALPMTQNELADATGMSTVHVNRTLQELRGDKLISLRGERLTVLDWDALKEAGDFDPTYLHLKRPERAAA